MPTLQKNSKGTSVAAWQRFLDLKPDGDFGDATVRATKAFQAEHNLREDGKVGPATLNVAFEQGFKFPATAALDNTRVEVCLPESGIGYKGYNREAGGADQYGTAFTIEAIQRIAEKWNEIHPEIVLQIGDISRAGGGTFPPHASHKNGRDFDCRLIRSDNQLSPCTISDNQYDAARTEALVRLVRENYPSAIIYCNDPKLIAKKLTLFCAGHHNHLHFRLK